MQFPITIVIIYILITMHILCYFNPSIILFLYLIENKFIQHIACSFFHVDIPHLLMNCITLFSFKTIEQNSHKKYIILLLYFLVVNALLWYLIDVLYGGEFSIGFSGILFGLLTLYPSDELYGIRINPIYFPPALLMLTQLLIPSASFIGHLIGIISAYIYVYLRNQRMY
jgi:rhomboid domain-containing protein 1